MATNRPGFTNVRICLGCHAPIGKDDRCGCPATHPFTRGALVTVCEDEARAQPLRLGVVGRLGNGAFRLEGTREWYDFDGAPSLGDTKAARRQKAETAEGGVSETRVVGPWVRVRQPGDEAHLARRAAAQVMLANITEWEARLDKAEVSARVKRTNAAMAAHDAQVLERDARVYDVAAYAEAAREVAAREAQLRVDAMLARARDLHAVAAKYSQDAEFHEGTSASARALLEALPCEVRAARMLGDREALRAYLLGAV